MGWFWLKKMMLVILLLVILLISSNFETCNARRGKHWKRVRGGDETSTLWAKKKSRGISGWSSSYHHIRSKSRTWKKHSPSTSISPLPTTKAPSPTSNPSPKPPPPSPPPTNAPSPKPSPPLPPPTNAPSPKPCPPLPPPTNAPSPPPPINAPSPPPTKSPTPTSSPTQKPSPKLSPPPPSPKTSISPPFPPPGVHSKNFNVLDFGARGNGVLDDTKSFQTAWVAACKVEGSTIVVPSDHVFLVGPISFSGPYCQTNIVFQLDGTIIAPTSTAAWGSGTLQWLEFTKLKSITIRGKGIIDGRGSGWWSSSRQFEFEPISNELAGAMPHMKPTALRLYGSYNVTVTGITIQNSPQCHLKFDNCVGVEVFNMTISSPVDSLNTDGIHLQNSKDVSVHHNQLGCGDDCISIQTGCSNVNIHHVNCGPGHGISIGGLGRDNTKACVSNITVQNVQLQGTMTGVSIKTWQGGSGSVQNIRFSNIQVKEVQTPIVIDQFYCDRATCKNQSAAVSLSGISYENIKGTFTVKPVHLACSDSSPCSDITLNEIELQPLPQRYQMYDVFCWQMYGFLRSQIIPPIECLQAGKPAKNLIDSDPDSC